MVMQMSLYPTEVRRLISLIAGHVADESTATTSAALGKIWTWYMFAWRADSSNLLLHGTPVLHPLRP